MANRKSSTPGTKLRTLGPQIEELLAEGKTWEEIASFLNEGSSSKHTAESVRKAWSRLNDSPPRKQSSPTQRPLQGGLTERLTYNPGSGRSFIAHFDEAKRDPKRTAATDEPGSYGQITILGPDGAKGCSHG